MLKCQIVTMTTEFAQLIDQLSTGTLGELEELTGMNHRNTETVRRGNLDSLINGPFDPLGSLDRPSVSL
jgi:hypothetical protein